MGFTLVKDKDGDICGFWFSDAKPILEAHRQTEEMQGTRFVSQLQVNLLTLASMHSLPLDVYSAISKGDYRVVPNTFSDAGGCFVMLGSALAPGEFNRPEENFFKVLGKQNKPEIVEIVRDIYEWSKQHADSIWFWADADGNVLFSFHYLNAGRKLAPFTIDTDGMLSLNLGSYLRPMSTTTLRQFYDMVHRIPTMQNIPKAYATDRKKLRKFSVKVEALKNSEYLQQFKQAILWLKTQPIIT